MLCFLHRLLLHLTYFASIKLDYYDSNPASFKFQNKGTNYGFVEYDDPGSAEQAMAQLNNRKVLDSVNLKLITSPSHS